MKSLLKLEELAQLLLAGLVVAHLPYAWWVLPATCLLPDLSMLGYLAGPRVGAASYNLAHHKATALAVGGRAGRWGCPCCCWPARYCCFTAPSTGCWATASSTAPAFRIRTWAGWASKLPQTTWQLRRAWA